MSHQTVNMCGRPHPTCRGCGLILPGNKYSLRHSHPKGRISGIYTLLKAFLVHAVSTVSITDHNIIYININYIFITSLNHILTLFAQKIQRTIAVMRKTPQNRTVNDIKPVAQQSNRKYNDNSIHTTQGDCSHKDHLKYVMNK